MRTADDDFVAVCRPQIAGAVLSFCAGLFLIAWFYPLFTRTYEPSMQSQVWRIFSMAMLTALVYWNIRRTEGDFRALFFSTLLLYVAAEFIRYFETNYDPLNPRKMSILLLILTIIFSGLAFTAYLADIFESKEKNIPLPSISRQLIVFLICIFILSSCCIIEPLARSLNSFDQLGIKSIKSMSHYTSILAIGISLAYYVIILSKNKLDA